MIRHKFISTTHLLATLCGICLSVICGCQRSGGPTGGRPLFSLKLSTDTGIDFENTLSYTNDFNIYKYRNYYNGGGVGLGDVNNDGLLDLYLSANLESNRLYLNKGSFEFDDITDKAGVGGKRSWSTGVSMVDVNADGWLDIYVCNSGIALDDGRQNELFINNGDGSFTDQAENVGLADIGFSTHASFFDYDKDGDLDVYILNNSYKAIGSFNLRKNQRPIRDSLGGDKLYRNDGMTFIDVTAEAGLYGSEIGFGLGVAVADLDKDGWMDMYISNDFFEKDYLYMNNRDGTFREELEKGMRSISGASMGSDTGDLNGDGYPDIFVTEMLPEGDRRYKTTMTFENWDTYRYNLENGYYHQFTRNMLHVNNGPDQKHGLTFSEVGRMSNVEATDWSWSALIFDLDNDGFKDLFVANGIAQDILNQDYLQFVSSEEVKRSIIQEAGVDYKKLIDIIPVSRISNYAFAGNDDLDFEDRTEAWGLEQPSHSNGSAYGDLDNDGDLDLVVNNVNMPVFIYDNQTERKGANFLKVDLEGTMQNLSAIGAKVTLMVGDKILYQEQNPVRGFQSSVDHRLNFGMGSISLLDSVVVDWYYGARTVVTNVKANQTLVLREEDAIAGKPLSTKLKEPVFMELDKAPIDVVHIENEYVDFNSARLSYHMKSTEGPKISVADINADGLDDLFLGGARGFPSNLLIQTAQGSFVSTNVKLFDSDKDSEDMGSTFLDVEGDGDMDLYVNSGGSETPENSWFLTDRLYINDGIGRFTKSPQILPINRPESTSVSKASDFDNDGDLDLFVGVRLRSKVLGAPQKGYLLVNDGSGQYRDETQERAPNLNDVGMITDAIWTDCDQDGDDDLIVVGEWMKIRLLRNDNGTFADMTEDAGLNGTEGWWNCIESADLDQDGDMDLVVGNHGLNSRFKADSLRPITCYINDFDRNGTVEQIVCTYNQDKSYPLALRHDLVSQLPHLKKKYLKYEAYSNQQIEDLYPPEILEKSVIHQARLLTSVIAINNGDGSFVLKYLPREAQVAPIYAIDLYDFDGDQKTDILLGGNLHGVKPEVGRYDASYGVYLKGNGKGHFEAMSSSDSGIFFNGEVRDFAHLDVRNKTILVVGKNNAKPQFYEIVTQID